MRLSPRATFQVYHGDGEIEKRIKFPVPVICVPVICALPTGVYAVKIGNQGSTLIRL